MNDDIVEKAKRLVSYCGTSDPFRIAKETGAEVYFSDLGKLKGMYSRILRNRFIVINYQLDEYMRKLVCAHELGHDQLHRELVDDKWLQEFMIYNMNSRPEYEANVFAAELLLPDEDILDLIGLEYDNEQIAQATNTDPNLVGIKVSTLFRRGYNFRIPGYRADFLKGK
jgi:Zn-dependent peptidase ImmA (M78 family)